MKTPDQVIADREADLSKRNDYIQQWAEKHIDSAFDQLFDGECARVNLYFRPPYCFDQVNLTEGCMETLHKYLGHWRIFQSRGCLLFIRGNLSEEAVQAVFKKVKQTKWKEITNNS